MKAGHSRRAVAKQCLGCHDETYLASLEEWTKGMDRRLKEVRGLLRKGDVGLHRARKERTAPEARRLLEAARADADLVAKAGATHNPKLAEAILANAKKTAEHAVTLLPR